MINQRDYPLWHGTAPMATMLRDMIDDGKFLEEGEGIRVRDRAGRWYLDGRSALWNVTLGYRNPVVTEAIIKQLAELPMATLLSYDRPAAVTVEYARTLATHLPDALRHIRLGNSGSQMTETAVLVSRFHRRVTGEPDRTDVICLQGSFHGTGPTASALSGLNPLGSTTDAQVHHVSPEGSWSHNVAKCTEQIGPERVTAVMIEPIMGTYGAVPDAADLGDLARYCRSQGIHLIGDEVSTGFGRTGALSHLVDLGIEPDMLVLGKGITSGYVPAAALAVGDTIWDAVFDPPSGAGLPLGSTTDGHPLAAAAGLAVLRVLYDDGLLATVAGKGKVLLQALTSIRDEFVPAGDVAGAGLMCRFALRDGNGERWAQSDVGLLRRTCEAKGLLFSSGLGCVWFMPPLITSESECGEMANIVASAFTELRRAGTLPA